MQYLTYSDAVESIFDYLGGTPNDQTLRDAKRAVSASYLDLVNAHTWSYLRRLGRINTVAPYDTGTVSYAHTGGTYERQLTLNGGVWPGWILRGVIRINNTNYDVERVISSTVVVLSSEFNPLSNLTNVKYVAYQDSYLLPEDLVSQDKNMFSTNFGGMEYVSSSEWANSSRYRYTSGTPCKYSIVGDDKLKGRLAVKMYPSPGTSNTIDFMYKRRPRTPSIYQETGAPITVAAESNEATIASGAFGSIVGCVIRFSVNEKMPDSWVGRNPPVFESLVVEKLSPTTVRLADAPSFLIDGKGWVASDLIDIEYGAMKNVFLRGCEKQISMNRTLKDKPSASRQYDEALATAKDADSRSFAGRSEGTYPSYRQRKSDMPGWPNE